MKKKYCDSYSTTTTNHHALIDGRAMVYGKTNHLAHLLQPQSTYSSIFFILKPVHCPHGKRLYKILQIKLNLMKTGKLSVALSLIIHTYYLYEVTSQNSEASISYFKKSPQKLASWNTPIAKNPYFLKLVDHNKY